MLDQRYKKDQIRWFWVARTDLKPGQLILFAEWIGIVREQKEKSTTVEITESSWIQTLDFVSPVARVLVFFRRGGCFAKVQNVAYCVPV